MKRKSISLFLLLVLVVNCVTFASYTKSYATTRNMPIGFSDLKQRPTTNNSEIKFGDGIIVQLTKDGSSYKKGDTLIKDVVFSKVWDFGKTKVGLVKSNIYSNKQLLKKVQSLKTVSKATYNYKKHIFSNDAYSNLQWNLSDTSKHGISIDTEWTKGNTGSSENIVAVIDTGIDFDNPEFTGKIWNNPYQPTLAGAHGYDFVNNDSNPSDDFGHGTFCSGIIAASNDGTGVQGINKNVKIMSLKVFDSEGYGEDANIISAYNYIYKALTLKNPANIVAINCSYGGYEYNPVEESLLNKLGELGVIVCCAAGNESNNNDENPAYPASYNCPNVISVAALSRDGNLAQFSNYGTENVDIAAPGADILSTTNDYVYNPTLYPSNSTLNQAFFDCSSKPENTKTNIEDADYSIDSSNGFLSGEKCLKVNFKPFDTDEYLDWKYLAIPYTVPSDFNKDKPINFSSMVKLECNHEVTEEELYAGDFSEFLYFDVPASVFDNTTKEGKQFEAHNFYSLIKYNFDGYYVSSRENYYTHMNLSTEQCTDEQINKYEPNQQRYILIVGYGSDDFTAYIDDIGISNSVSNSALGKYDFWNGTSFAAPQVTGAIALMNAADKSKSGFSKEMILNDVMSACDDSLNLNVNTKGTLDFSKRENNFWLNIGSVKIDSANNQIIIDGAFDVGDGTIKLEIAKSSNPDSYTEVTNFATKTNSKLIFNDQGSWINNKVNIKITGTKNGKTKVVNKNNVLLNAGKNTFVEFEDVTYPAMQIDSIATDGTLIFVADSALDAIYSYNPDKLISGEGESQELITIDDTIIQEIYEPNSENKNTNFEFSFNDNMVYLNNKLYVMASYGETTEESISVTEDGNDIYIEYLPATYYYSERKLLEIPVDNPSALREVPLPSGYDRIADFTLAGYNGKLLVLGGYDYSQNGVLGELTKKVYSMNSNHEWTEQASMPSPRAGGKALQSGDNLIYTLGYTDSTLFTGNNQSLTLPENYIYDGKEWKKSGKSLRSFSQTKIERGNKAYASVNSNIGISRDGLTYINTPVYDYGDTYTYNASTDTFKDTGYSYLGEDEVVATVVDNDIYAYDDIACITYKAEDAIDSGLIKISGVSNKHGKIKGTGKILPGSITTIKSRSNSGYYTTNLSASGIKATKNCARGMYLNIQSTKDIKVKAEYAKFIVKNKSHDHSIKVGEKYRIKTMISPKKAAKQWKLSYKSSNKKYATVSSKGVVTAKNAGKGKTVTITVKLRDSGKTVNKFKVTIR